METLEALGRKIRTAHDLLSVVKTMKSLAALNIRQYEGAANSMNEYASVIAQGWQGFFHNRPHLPMNNKKGESVYLVLGSDQGMCGQFNEVIMQYALSFIRGEIELTYPGSLPPEINREGGSEINGKVISASILSQEGPKIAPPHLWAAGERVQNGMEEMGVEEQFYLPSSMGSISDLMVDIVERLALLRESRPVDKFIIFYNHLVRAGTYEPGLDQLLPLDHGWHDQQRRKKWPTRCFPMLGIHGDLLFETLFQQHIFASIYKAFAHSLASENLARLAAMQAAEKNIMEMEEDLQGSFRETRQNAITAELLDIISGFEAIKDTQ